MRLIDNSERRARLAVRHGLSPKAAASDVPDAARSMVGLHSSDPATVYLSIVARVPGVGVEDIEHALYEARSVVRLLGMRRTLWVLPTEFASVVHSSSTVALRERERAKAVEMIASAGIADAEAWLERVTALTLDAIKETGEVLARDLTKRIPELREKITFRNKASRVLGTVGMSTRVLFLLSAYSKIIRARPAGSWISSQYRWASTEYWLGAPIEERPVEGARADLLGAWLGRFGPATGIDLKWWTGWPMGQVRKALEAVGAVEVQLEGGSGFVLPHDQESVESPAPWVALLPSLDPTTMGWKQRSWYLEDGYERLFDQFGNAGPTVWVHGRIVGGWAQAKSGEVRYEVFEDVGSEAIATIESNVQELQQWLGEVVVTPRFRSAHDKELANR